MNYKFIKTLIGEADNSTKKIYLLIITTLLFLSGFLVNCSEPDEYEDIDVTVVSVFKSGSAHNRKAIVQYTLENIGTKTINGWEIFFYIKFKNNPQQIAADNAYYTLDPGKISSARNAEARIPTSYNDNSEPSSAIFKNIETW